MLSMPAMAQRDFLLTKQRNVWLTSANAAALTTFSDSTIAHATLSYSHADGTRRSLSDGKRQDVYGADVQSFFRLSPSVVAYGRAAYENRSVTEAAGSMFFPTSQLMPFDLVEEDEGNAGDKGMETFNVDGAIGWQVTRHMAFGAQLNYSSGTYAKHRDLRHSNTLMDLDARVSAFFRLPHNSGVGAGLVYRRRSETMLFTSGTTGTSKCVMLCQKNIFAAVNAAVETVCFSADDVVVSVLPIHHTYELMCVLAEMVYGIEICINDSLRHVMKNFQLFKPTGLVLVPLFINTMYAKIWSEAKKSKKETILKAGLATSKTLMAVGIDARRKIFKSVLDAFGGRLDHIICGGAKLNPDLIAAFEDFGISIFEGCGITECSPLTCVTPYFARKYGSVGPAVPCCRVRIDEKTGSGENEEGYVEGEIQIKGDNVMLGYYNNPEANEAAFTTDGWYRTGDIGYMDGDGYVYITGRMKSVIVLENGKNVFPEEIEEYLGKIDTICESVVVGRKAPDSDAIILTAVVFPAYDKFPTGASEELIRESIRNSINAMNRRLPGFKQVKAVEYRQTEFEKTTSKKIKRHLVK